MVKNCVSCKYGKKRKGGYDCRFPVPFYLVLKGGRYVVNELQMSMECNVWKEKITEKKGP